jgi:hypothetical protein
MSTAFEEDRGSTPIMHVVENDEPVLIESADADISVITVKDEKINKKIPQVEIDLVVRKRGRVASLDTEEESMTVKDEDTHKRVHLDDSKLYAPPVAVRTRSRSPSRKVSEGTSSRVLSLDEGSKSSLNFLANRVLSYGSDDDPVELKEDHLPRNYSHLVEEADFYIEMDNEKKPLGNLASTTNTDDEADLTENTRAEANVEKSFADRLRVRKTRSTAPPTTRVLRKDSPIVVDDEVEEVESITKTSTESDIEFDMGTNRKSARIPEKSGSGSGSDTERSGSDSDSNSKSKEDDEATFGEILASTKMKAPSSERGRGGRRRGRSRAMPKNETLLKLGKESDVAIEVSRGRGRGRGRGAARGRGGTRGRGKGRGRGRGGKKSKTG